ncbi:hypothetical protein NQ318_022435 [Aromia moschata]|uniref:Sodefrin-like factor n=1 Tax=Aromia moschata TaxID=1265417 RepID=A0AAV8Z4T3_9CUCU|nr:hypothetical protein NQ318_022435 [Aromia moschata]
MKAALCTVFLIYFMYAYVDIGSALKCYTCSTTTGYGNACETNVNNRTVASSNCTFGYNVCMTLQVNSTITRSCAVNNVCSIFSNATGFIKCSICKANLLVTIDTITRACAMSNVCSTYYNSPGFHSCSTCVQDLCNYMRASGASTATPLGVLTILYIVMKYI